MNNLPHSPVSNALEQAVGTLRTFISNRANLSMLDDIAGDIAACFNRGGKLLSCGNGGSACEAIHIAEEFSGRYRKDRRALPALSLTEPACLTCVGNDYGFDNIFSRAVEAFGKPGDILFALTTSGNSPNIIRAVEAAKTMGLKVILIMGRDGGKLKGAGHRELIVDGPSTDRIQEIHMVCLHVMIEMVERRLFPENYA